MKAQIEKLLQDTIEMKTEINQVIEEHKDEDSVIYGKGALKTLELYEIRLKLILKS
jgi:hypothetical protein